MPVSPELRHYARLTDTEHRVRIDGLVVLTTLLAALSPFTPRSGASAAQVATTIIEPDDRRSGPRIGAAYIIGGSRTAELEGTHIQPMMTLFGWQWEHAFSTGIRNAPLPIVEFIGLIGGLEQNQALASTSFIIGVRQPSGWEAGVGPTFTGAGAQLSFAGGMTRSVGLLNFPINLAVTPGRRGASISLTTGFNRRRR